MILEQQMPYPKIAFKQSFQNLIPDKAKISI